MFQSPEFLRENLDELELHLRDSIAMLLAGGLSEEEAFLVSLRRIGKGADLAAEFGRVNQLSVWLDRSLWMLVGIQLWGLISGLTEAVASTALVFGWGIMQFDVPNSMAFPVVFFTLVRLVALAASLTICWWGICKQSGRSGPRITQWLKRPSAFIMAFVGLLVLTLLIKGFLGLLPALVGARYFGPASFGRLTMSSNLARLFVTSLQLLVMIAVTFVLVRKKLRRSVA